MARYAAQPAGTLPALPSTIVPDRPELAPAVNSKINVALEQLWNVSVAVPTAAVVCVGGVPASNTPPLVSYSISTIERVPAVYGACAVNHR